MRIAICDDEDYCGVLRDALAGLVSREDSIAVYRSAAALLEAFSGGIYFDMAFLDIVMPGMSGIEAAKEIRTKSSQTVIIFVTAYENLSIETHIARPLDFLVKPVEERKLQALLAEARTLTADRPMYHISTQQTDIWLPVGDIYYVDVQRRQVTIHHARGETTFYGTIKSVFQVLQPHGFFQIHRSILVNVCHIRFVDKEKMTALMRGGDELPIAAIKMSAFKKYYLQRRGDDYEL